MVRWLLEQQRERRFLPYTPCKAPLQLPALTVIHEERVKYLLEREEQEQVMSQRTP